MSITELSIKRPTLIVVIVLVLCLFGTYSYRKLNYELLPNISMPVIMITTVYPGAGPSEVENSISKKIEDAVSNLENIDNIKSYSQENISLVIVELKVSANVYEALQNVQRKVNTIMAQLPENTEIPVVSKFGMDDFPIINLAATAEIPSTRFYDIVKNRIEPALARIEGVGEVILVGGEEREIKINISKQKLEKYNLSVLQVAQAIQLANLDFPTGKVKNSSQQILIRLSGKYKSVSDIENLVIAEYTPNSPVRLTDIADIQDGIKDVQSINRFNGNTSIGVLIKKQADANTVKVSEKVKQAIVTLEKEYFKENLKFTVASDQSEFTLEAANAVMKDLFLAVILVALVMLVFLHSIRNSFIVLIAIPISIISTFIAIYIFDFSLNLMSLLAMSLSVGILVDDSIVVIENIYRHIELGKDKISASVIGRTEIGFTALSITLVDVAVFLPIAIVDTIISGYLRQFALVVVVATLLSLLVSFTVTPLLTSRIAKIETFKRWPFIERFITFFERQIDAFAHFIQKILRYSIHHKAITLIGAIVLFFGSIALIPFGFIGSEFVDMGDRGELILQLELLKFSTINETNRIVKEVESIILTKPEVKHVFSQVGSTSDMTDISAGANKAEINVKLIDRDKRNISSSHYAQILKNELAGKILGVKFMTSLISPIGGSDQVPLQIAIKCSNSDTLTKYSSIIYNEVKSIPGTSDVKLSIGEGNPELVVNIDRAKMANLGLSMEIVGLSMQTAFSGNSDTKFKDGEFEYDINIRFDEFDRRNTDDVSNLVFVNNIGQQVKLSQFANIAENIGASRIERNGRILSVAVNSQVFGRPMGDVGDDIKKRIANIYLPPEVLISYEGDMKNQAESFGSLGLALIASIIFIYLLMVALYESFVYPFVVLFSVPLAIIGALFMLAITNQTLNIFTLLGLIMLIGLVSKNAILVVDFTNNLRKQGFKIEEALIQATHVRLRPILMTTFSMIIAMLPIALASGAGAEWKNGLAWVLIGGLSCSMFLSLIIVPVVYIILFNTLELIKNTIFKP